MINSKDQGAALLTVLAIVAVMSAAAVTALNALTRSVNLTRTVSERNQAVLASQSIESAGAALISSIMTTGIPVTQKETSVTLPFPRGQIIAKFEDASNCFNLNRLGEPDGELAREQFQKLLIAADFFESEAERLSDTLSDWIDSDDIQRTFGAEGNIYRLRETPHLAANTKLINLSELYAIEGYSRDVVERLKPLVCIRPDNVQPALNIDTISALQAPLLTALYSDEISRDEAESLILSRPIAGWQTPEAFFSSSEISQLSPEVRNDEIISTQSTMIALNATAVSGRITQTQYFLFDVSGGATPQFLSSGIGTRP